MGFNNKEFAESTQAKDEGDVTETFEYEKVDNAKMSKNKEATVNKHAQKEFKMKNGYLFEKLKSPEKEEEYNKMFEESSKRYTHIA